MIKTEPHGTVSPQMMYKRFVYTSPDLLIIIIIIIIIITVYSQIQIEKVKRR